MFSFTSKPDFKVVNTLRQHGFTFVELLVIMIMLAIIVSIGSTYSFKGLDNAKINASINEMRNMVGFLKTLETRGTDTIINFPSAGTIAALNTSISTTFTEFLPATNKFDTPYYFTISPLLSIYTNIKADYDIKPIGFIDSAIVSNTNSTTLTVYYRSDIKKIKNHRRNWVQKFFYDEDDLIAKQRNLNQYDGDYYVNKL